MGGRSPDGGGKAAYQERLAQAEKRDAEAEALRLANEREDAQALAEKEGLTAAEVARKKKQAQLNAGAAEKDPTSLLG